MKVIYSLTAAAAVLALVACGGGGGGSSSSSVGSELSGTVAVGAPIRGATVQVFGPQGNVLAETQSGADGKYNVRLPAGAQGPFVIKASYADEALYSVHTGEGGVANVSQLTNAVTAMLSPTGAPDGFQLNPDSTSTVTSARVNSAVQLVQSALAPVASAIDDLPTAANFLNTPFDANGTGIDRLLDASSISLTATSIAGAPATNIDLVVNVSQDLNQVSEGQSLVFDSTQAQSVVSANAARLSISGGQLPPSNMGRLYQDFLARLNACYALPKDQRASGDQITAQACKDIFHQSNPSAFLDGGLKVKDRFGSLFTADTTIQFTSTVDPIIVQNLSGLNASGKALIAAKGQDDQGNYSYNRFYVEQFTLNGSPALGILGDQNPHEFYVISENEYRTFARSGLDLDFIQSQFAFILRVPNAKHAVVEGPSGRFFMAPVVGRDNFRMCRQLSTTENIDANTSVGDCKGAPLLIHATEFVNPQVERPRNVTSPLHFDHIVSDFLVARDEQGQPLSDDRIRQIRNGATWKATVFLNNNQSLNLFTHNAGRPMTSAELRGADSPMIRAASLTKLTMAEGNGRPARVVDFAQPVPLNPNVGIGTFQQRNRDSVVTNRWTDSRIPAWAPLEGGFKFDWSVSSAQIPPFILFVSGQVRLDWNNDDRPIINNNIITKSRQPMEDSRRFRVAARSLEVFCSPTPAVTRGGETIYDESCDADLDSNNQFSSYLKDSSNNHIYNPGTWMTSTSLISRDQQQRNIIRGYNWFIPTTTSGGSTSWVEPQP